MNRKINTFFSNYFDEYIKENPLMATFIGIHNNNHLYPNYYSDSEIKKGKEFDKKYLKIVKTFLKVDGIKPKEKHYLKVLKSRLENNLEGYNYPFELLPMDQFNNVILYYIDLASGKSYLPLKTKKDFQNLILKTKDFITFNDTCICRMREGISKKIIPSKTIIKLCIKQLKDNIKKKEYVLPLNKVLISVRDEYIQTLDKEFTLMVKKTIDFLHKEYLPFGTNKLECPGGKKMYQYLVKSYTTLANPNIEKIHKLGFEEIERINKNMDELFKNNNMRRPSPKELKKRLYKNKPQVLSEYERIRKLVNTKIMPKYFDITISHDYLLKKVPKFKEEYDSGAYYMMCSIDSKRKGTFYLNMANLEDHLTFNTLSLSLHEGNPGHHFQLTYNNDNNIPKFITYCGDETAYVEGWGLYSESLAHDFYENPKTEEDVMYRFGCYNYEMLRACRLVIDTGIHYYGWTFDKCFGFMKKHTNFSDKEIEVEIYRYSSYPAQALSYKIGELKIKELRKYYLKKGGSIKKFHKDILKFGACPLHLLEKNIKDII
tara:strand:+ start:70 stop:1701 length:1632 start_codon:yes stop_codon:yes gene_type:complete